jgi:hypothetical protein
MWEKATNIRTQIDTLGRGLVRDVMTLQAQLYACQERYKQELISKKKRDSMNLLVKVLGGVTVGVGATGLGILSIRQGTGFVPGATAAAIAGYAGINIIQSIIDASAPGKAFPKDGADCYKPSLSPSVGGNLDASRLGCTCYDAGLTQNIMRLKTQEYISLVKRYQAETGVNIIDQETLLKASVIKDAP